MAEMLGPSPVVPLMVMPEMAPLATPPFVNPNQLPTLPAFRFPPYEGQGIVGTDMMGTDPTITDTRLAFLSGLPPADLQRELEFIKLADSLALSHLGSPEEWKQMEAVQRDKPVMAHELGHALIAYDNQLSGDFTAIEGHYYRGLTTIYGTVPDEKFSVIAAGSTFSHDFGPPRGFGHDRTQIQNRFAFGNGLPLTTAEDHAHNHLKQYQTIFPRIAEIATALQHTLELEAIPFSLIPDILERARQEAALKVAGIEQDVYKWLTVADETERNMLKQQIHSMLMQKPPDYKQIIDTADGRQLVRVVAGGQIVDEYENCPACLGRNGHKEGCSLLIAQPANYLRPDTQLEPEDKTVYERVPAAFSTKGVVFVGSD